MNGHQSDLGEQYAWTCIGCVVLDAEKLRSKVR